MTTAAVILVLSTASAAAEPVRIEHDALRCVVAERFPVLRARIHPAEGVQRAKVYFRASGPHWYAVPMRAEGAFHVAMLPRPRKTLETFTYYVEAIDREAAVVRTAEASPVIAESAAACGGGAVAAAAETGVVALEAPAGAPAVVPAGFSANGVTVTAAGAAAAGAAAGAAVAGAGAAAAAGGGGIGGTALVAGGLVVAGGAAAAVVATRDGGGPCTEGGGFEFSVESSLEGGDWACAQSHTLTIRVRNHSCEKLRFESGEHHRVERRANGGTSTTPQSGFTLDDVDPGGELVHREPTPPSIACSINPGAGPPDRRDVEWIFTIPSNLGPATDTVRFTYDFAGCPRCSS